MPTHLEKELNQLLKNVFCTRNTDSDTKINKNIVQQTDTGYRVYVDLPGVKTDDILISVDGDKLNISASRTDIYPDNYNYMYVLDDDADVDNISATSEYGVLLVDVPVSKKKTKIKIISVH